MQYAILQYDFLTLCLEGCKKIANFAGRILKQIDMIRKFYSFLWLCCL